MRSEIGVEYKKNRMRNVFIFPSILCERELAQADHVVTLKEAHWTEIF
jgi:hypothetical protein